MRVIFSGSATNTGLFSSSGTSLSITVAGTLRGTFDNTGDLSMVTSLHAPTIRATTQLQVSTSTSGVVTLQALSTGGTYTLTFPTDDGTPNQVLTTDGSGGLSWTTASTGSGTVNSGTAGRLGLYATSTTAISDTYVQNTKNIDILIAAQGSRSANVEYTIPNPGNAVTATSFVLTDSSATLQTITSDITISRSSSGNVVNSIINTDAMDANANAILALTSGGTSAGSPYIHFNVTTATDWSIGLENSNNDSFVIAKSTALASNRYFQIDTSGGVTLAGALAMGTHKVTGLSNGSASDDAAAFGQIYYGFQRGLNLYHLN